MLKIAREAEWSVIRFVIEKAWKEVEISKEQTLKSKTLGEFKEEIACAIADREEEPRKEFVS